MISAVDLLKGLGVVGGLSILDIEGATGYIDTNYEGKAQAASSKRGSFDIQADESTNSLVITAPPDIMRTLKRVISQLDIGEESFWVSVQADITERKRQAAQLLEAAKMAEIG